MPKAREILQNFIYVDDVLFGDDDVSPRKSQSTSRVDVSRDGFHLRKWAANSTELLHDIPIREHELAIERSLSKDDTLKVLGLTWRPQEDAFRFQITSPSADLNTKRFLSLILSFIAKFFDPLGWVSPVIIVSKIIIQEL